MTATRTVRLDPGQIRAFLTDRLDGLGPCRVNESLALIDLAETSVLPNARILMRELIDGAKLTERGNLSRKLVGTLMDRFQWPGVDIAEIRQVCKVVNEQDYPPAMFLHAVLRAAGLARHVGGILRLTKAGRAVLADEFASRLQALLFRTTVTKYNLAYLDGSNYPEGIFEQQISLILFLIHRFCDEWQPTDAIAAALAVPHVAARSPGGSDLSGLAFEFRVLRYLMWFGLVERVPAQLNVKWPEKWLWRKAPLFDRMLSFKI